MLKSSKKVAVISDIHGNAIALSEVISDIKNNSVDSIICLGDVATLGPAPKETLKMIQELNCPCIVGNHEEALLAPEKAAEYSIKGEMLANTIHWCLEQLEAADISFLKNFIPSISIPLSDEKRMICYHGSPKSTIDSIVSTTPDQMLDNFIDFDTFTNVAIGGHTHFQMLRTYKDTLIVNTGSVGCAFRNPSFIPPSPSFLPVAEYVIIEYNGKNISLEFKSIEYDIKKFVSMIHHSSIPLKPWWLNEFKRLGY